MQTAIFFAAFEPGGRGKALKNTVAQNLLTPSTVSFDLMVRLKVRKGLGRAQITASA
jgi:hypothetical protein